MFYRSYGKKIIDWILSLIAIIIFSPILLVIAVLIKLTSKGPVIFKHKRLTTKRYAQYFKLTNTLLQLEEL